MQSELLLQCAVEREGHGEHERDPRQLAELHGHEHDAEEGEEDAEMHGRREPLLEEHDAERHIHQRIDVVAETRVDDVPVVHCPDVGQPVDGDQDRSAEKEQRAPPVMAERAAVLAESRPALGDSEDEQHEDERPTNAVGEDLRGGDRREEIPVERQESPDDIGGDSGDHAAFFLFHGARNFLYRCLAVRRERRRLMRARQRLAIHRCHEPFHRKHLQEREADDALGHEVCRVEGQRVDEGACACGSVGREEYDAAHDVAEKAREEGERRRRHAVRGEERGERERHVGQRIVEEHLHGMQQVGILHHVEDAVEEACEAACAESVAVGDEEQRHHRAERHAAALRHVVEAELVQDDRHGEHERDVYEHRCREPHAAEVEVREDREEHDEKHDEARRMLKNGGDVLQQGVHMYPSFRTFVELQRFSCFCSTSSGANAGIFKPAKPLPSRVMMQSQ